MPPRRRKRRHSHRSASRPLSPTHDFALAFGGIPDDPSAAQHNTAALNHSLRALKPGDTLLIPPRTFHVNGGVEAGGLRNVTICIDGRLVFSPDITHWPHNNGAVLSDPHEIVSTPRPPCPQPRFNWTRYSGPGFLAGIALWNCRGLTLTSSNGRGELHGNGRVWWSLPFLGYLYRRENRPRLLTIANSRDVLVERLLLVDSPFWTALFENVDTLEIRDCGVVARRTPAPSHSLMDLSAFNTDGFDVSGRNVWIHDCDIWTQDDAIAVKDQTVCARNSTDGLAVAIPSEDMLFERINASGLGLVVGSIGDGVVRNITFRDCYLRDTVKGIYLKFRMGRNSTGKVGLVRGITYERIRIDRPAQWPIWIGPAQQARGRNPCAADPCSLCWPLLPGASCTGSLTGRYEDIVLSDIQIYAPQQSAGVLLASPLLPMRGVTFIDVVVHAGCDAAQLKPGGFTSAFPLLQPTVPPDTLVHTFYALVAGAMLLALLAARACWVRATDRARSAAAGLGAILFAIIGALAARLAVWSPGSTSGYYVCEGIVDGVAMGSTWPVPPCFVDRTTRRLESPQRVLPCAYSQRGWLGAGGTLVGLFAVACLRRAWHGGCERSQLYAAVGW
uniref:Pectate lyase superfamily protein domain-containing protein n=1 Tax=Haptolina ericina TaxID=156174 RepID=A0A7S3C172_9EUKA|mmetsp:Transcript_73142/g.162442  ORF Transcript_73142/g.162442 Transcript_73142/m.162442 type:complete len:616 (+) Transcript_73142:50-1897(+)